MDWIHPYSATPRASWLAGGTARSLLLALVCVGASAAASAAPPACALEPADLQKAFGLTFDKARSEVQSDMQRLLGHIVDGKLTVDKALNVLGAKYSAEVKNTVTQGEQIQPPNAPSTLARKMAKTRAGAANAVRTLIDTGRMIGAVTWATFGSGK